MYGQKQIIFDYFFVKCSSIFIKRSLKQYPHQNTTKDVS